MMNKIILNIGLFCFTVLSFTACKKDVQAENTEIQTTKKAIPVEKEVKITTPTSINQESFEGAHFKAQIPEGFKALPSMGAGEDLHGYQSYFFISPDSLAQFYAYVSNTNQRPNDIVFPNERVETLKLVRGDTLITTWELMSNKQTPYQRIFTESAYPNGSIVTGFYYRDIATHDKYQAAFEAFKANIQVKN